jgi:pimeloyl-ACP methyl ester carboxylesterase
MLATFPAVAICSAFHEVSSTRFLHKSGCIIKLMMYKRLIFVVLLFMLCACLPIPTVQLDPAVPPPNYRVALSSVRTEYSSLPGYNEPSTPDEYDRTLYLRYFLPNETPETVFVLVPGIFGGATSVDIVARQLVSAIPNLEVWAVDRRANLLEDTKIMVEGLQTRNPQPAYDYYVTNFGTETGFKLIPPDEVRFMANWGLEVHLRDLHEIIKQAEVTAPKVILGGHSLAGAIVGYYAAFKFADGAGYTHLDGLVLIEGALGRTGGFDRKPQGINLGPLELVPGTEGLREGRGSPYLTFGFTPQFYARREAMALLARFEPDALFPGHIFDFPLTNRAAVGIGESNFYGPSTVFSSSLGRAINATFSGNLTAVILGGSQGIYSQSVTGVAEGYEFVDWDKTHAISDIDKVIHSWTNAYTNRSEWYFPVRLALDIGQYHVSLENTPGFIPNRLVTVPTLAVGAGRGLCQTLEAFSAYSNARVGSLFSSYVIPNFTHLDIVQATDNPLVGIVQAWLGQIP